MLRLILQQPWMAFCLASFAKDAGIGVACWRVAGMHRAFIPSLAYTYWLDLSRGQTVREEPRRRASYGAILLHAQQSSQVEISIAV